jgi:hypothetical protein
VEQINRDIEASFKTGGTKMRRFRLFTVLLQLLLVVTLLAGNAQAALLDLGANVPPVFGSTPPNLGHGFPIWFRDTNRVPLQLCMDENMCLFLRPNTAAPISFPLNMPDEVFFYSAEAQMTTTGGDALLFSGIEGNIAVDDQGNATTVSFARVRIRIDTTVAGNYVVTTPFKQYFFNDVPVGGRAINFTEDIGLGENGVHSGALKGNVGPFVYSVGAPFVTATGSYIGDNTPRPVTGSTFTDPLTGQPANVFRIEGPPGFTTVSTNLFAVTGQLYTEITPTPLEVDKVAYTRSSAGVKVSAFATTQALSNQTNPALAFPLNFALTGASSALQLSSPELPTQNMTTNAPADGKFFSASALLADPGTLPATVTVTNTADVPPVVKIAPLVDEVVISSASYNPVTKTLAVEAVSYDEVAAPALSLFMPGMETPVGTLVDGKISVTFPFTDSTAIPSKTYNIPPEKVTVVSALGGSANASVTAMSPSAGLPTGTIVINEGAAFTNSASVTLDLSASSPSGPVTQMQFSKDGVSYFAMEPFSSTRVVTLLPGNGTRSIYVRFADATGKISPAFSDQITFETVAPVGTIVINGGAALTNNSTVNLTLSATDANGVAAMQFSNDGINFSLPVPYATTASFNLSAGNGLKTVTARFIDTAGNVSAPASSIILLNAVSLTGTVAINGGATLTSSATATLTLSASSTAGAVTQMQFSKDGVNYFPYEPYATNRVISLLPGEGLRAIYVRFKDAVGNVSAPVSAGIVVDATKPTGTIAFSTPNPTNSTTGTLLLTATDANGVTQMQLSRDGVNFFPLESFVTIRTVSLSLGLNTLSVRFKDTAGNLSTPVSASITRN